jgi:hypothetical protein
VGRRVRSRNNAMRLPGEFWRAMVS